MIRTGLGYDLHKLVEGRKLIVGGIEIPFEKGELGHSDGDALLHAITDSLLGASGLGDIGSFFPDTDPQFKDADSAMLLQKAWKCVQDKGWKLENLDCVVLLEKPKFLPYKTQVQENIAKILNVNPDQIFVKAKTGEKLGDVGSSNAIEVFATCLLSK
ncbi:MAG: 2-C-methyl-D-erythritol 2,4-cyclodiphosphate synthase [Treponema sp.]|nr:2-C-methyl-D-erythritol 2,4-cyclodiphosphate synthase [Treponema sp.]